MLGDVGPWGSTPDELARIQERLAEAAEAAVATDPWAMPQRPSVGGCFVAYARGEAGPGGPGDRAWAAAVVWRPDVTRHDQRSSDRHLRGAQSGGLPRRADDVVAQAVAADRVASAYVPGMLAAREGPVLAAAVEALDLRPDVLLVDATGSDHPRAAGLALHLGAVAALPTVGVTRRPLVATGAQPELRRGARTALRLDGRCVGYWVCTRSGARPVVAHAAWRTTPRDRRRDGPHDLHPGRPHPRAPPGGASRRPRGPRPRG